MAALILQHIPALPISGGDNVQQNDPAPRFARLSARLNVVPQHGTSAR